MKNVKLIHRIEETLEVVARALFNSCFVGFDPVRTQTYIQRNAGLPRDITDLSPNRLMDSRMGDISEGWEMKPLRTACTKPRDSQQWAATITTPETACPTSKVAVEFGFRYPEKRRSCYGPTRVAHPEDTLFSTRAVVGDINLD